METLSAIFASIQGWLFEAAVQPAMLALGLANLLEDGYSATAWFLVGVIQILILLAVIGPLQRWRPVEKMDSPADQASIRVDVLYTLLHRLGLFRIALFFTLDPWQMTMWSDNRSHLLDSLLLDSIMVLVAQIIGVAPDQFIVIVALTQLSESFQHANLRLSFGRVGERLWVSPRFHRLHHSIGIGHESGGAKTLGGHNFGVLLPWWDVFFGTANFESRYDPTGIRDQVENNRDYGSGFWSQQWIGMKRLFGRASAASTFWPVNANVIA